LKRTLEKKLSVNVLSGGVGGAKLVLGLSHLLEPDGFVVIANTGDDFRHLGLKICPDIDTLIYTLANLVDTERGWGLKNETWNFLKSLKRIGGEEWFNLGDSDLATHVERTRRLAAGETLSVITRDLLTSFGVKFTILPMTDNPVSTVVETLDGPLAFQHYFVRDRCLPSVTSFRFDGIEKATPNPLIIKHLKNNADSSVLIAPSNPFVSIDPILSVPTLKQSLLSVKGPRVAVSPIIRGKAIKGPAAKMMNELGIPVTSLSIANHYKGFIDGIVIDELDKDLSKEIEDTGAQVLVANTVMNSLKDKISLANECMKFIGSLGK
jgi:LPPG:FO 2-phospho-L-lactate transferase